MLFEHVVLHKVDATHAAPADHACDRVPARNRITSLQRRRFLGFGGPLAPGRPATRLGGSRQAVAATFTDSAPAGIGVTAFRTDCAIHPLKAPGLPRLK